MLTIHDDLRRDSSSLDIVNIAVESTTRVKPVFASDASMANRSIGNHSNNDLVTINGRNNSKNKNKQHYKTNRADGGHGEDLLSVVEQINNNE